MLEPMDSGSLTTTKSKCFSSPAFPSSSHTMLVSRDELTVNHTGAEEPRKITKIAADY